MNIERPGAYAPGTQKEGNTVKYNIVKAMEGFYILVITREDGSSNDYRFATKAQLTSWMKLAGIK